MSQDEHWAAAALATDTAPRPPQRRMQDWSPEMEMLTNLYDRLGELIRAVIAAAGGKPRRIVPAPRPRTALERVRNRRRADKHRQLVARVLPHRATGS